MPTLQLKRLTSHNSLLIMVWILNIFYGLSRFIATLISLFFCIFSNPAFAQSFSPLLQQAYAAQLSGCPDKAQQFLNLTPTTGEKIVLQNYGYFFRLITLYNPKLYDNYVFNETQAIDQLQNLPNTETKLFFQAEILVQWAFLHLQYGHEWKALQSFRQAYKLLKTNQLQYPHFLPQQKTDGLLQVLLAAVPTNYQWALSLFGLQGNEKEGLAKIALVAKSQNFYALEAQVLHVLLTTFVRKRHTQSIELLTNYQLLAQAQRPETPAFVTYFVALLCVKSGKAAQALTLLANTNLNSICLALPTLPHLKAEAHLLVGNYAQAQTLYEDYLAHCPNNLYVKDSYYKICLVALLQGNAAKALQTMPLIHQKGDTRSNPDKTAQKFATTAQPLPHPTLLKIQLWTDGGEFEKALQLVEKQELKNFTSKEQYEFQYRKARLLHRSQQHDKALAAYQTLLDLPYLPETYFAPMAALQLAILYSEVYGQPQKAKLFAQKVLTYSKYEYESSMRQEAKKIVDS